MKQLLKMILSFRLEAAYCGSRAFHGNANTQKTHVRACEFMLACMCASVRMHMPAHAHTQRNA